MEEKEERQESEKKRWEPNPRLMREFKKGEPQSTDWIEQIKKAKKTQRGSKS